MYFYLTLGLVYALFFLSGSASLMYEVVWVRSLSLIFGGTHLAVTVVLSVFMAGLALGSYAIGRSVDRIKKPLRLYGYLEIGIALSALAFSGLMKIYPSVYIYLAQGHEDHRLYLTLVRAAFSVFALLVPTTLMGGTLPVLTRFVSRNSVKMGTQLSLLYGFNTLGAVAGTMTAGFYLLRLYSVSMTLHTAIVMNMLVGFAAVLLSGRASAIHDNSMQGNDNFEKNAEENVVREEDEKNTLTYAYPVKMVLLGIGVSGFCALGYEVLWTRILTLTIGTSVYGFTIMLVAFLAGIAFGSGSYGLFHRLFPSVKNEILSRTLRFGIVQCIIGVTALFVTINIRDLPVHALSLNSFYLSRGMSVFDARQWANMTLAFSYMFVPAFFMGSAFPLAGTVIAHYRKRIGYAVGNVLAYNTVGSILGSAVSGFVLIYLLGLERSLQFLTVVNIGAGLLIILSTKNSKVMSIACGVLTLASLLFLMTSHNTLRVWDAKFFAIFQNNLPAAYDTPEKKQDAIANTDVLYYHEGVNSTISSIKVKGGNQAVLVNGKVVASASLGDRQCQLALGHLPMLLHKNPQKVLVVGLGTGMTAGAVSIHPSVKDLTLAEIEPNVTGCARTFGKYNHYVLDNPKLKIIFNDGRNFLMTTKNKYDVITADPIHPWTQGSGYLYTDEYFRIASEHLLPDGIMCQWLPIYELKVEDLKSIVRTFSLHFRYTMAWLTAHDVELIGSNSPIIIDEKELERRISYPPLLNDLEQVSMGSATDFLSYFVMGTNAMAAFSSGGVINTDDNLYLEFSTPASVGINTMGYNLSVIARYRESILPYLVPEAQGKFREAQMRKWNSNASAAMIEDRARALFIGGHDDEPEFRIYLAESDKKYPEFAPGRFLHKEYLEAQSHVPALLQKIPFPLRSAGGENVVIEISAVIVRAGEERAAVIFVDNAAKKIFGQAYLSGPDLNSQIRKFVQDVFLVIQTTYRRQAELSRSQGQEYPAEGITMERIQDDIRAKVQAYHGS